MSNDTITVYGLLETVRMVAREVMEYNPDATDIDELYDAISEHADGLVNVYYRGCAEEWLAVGMPTPKDFGLENHPSGDIHQTIAYTMYYWYDERVREAVKQLLDQRNDANEETD